MQAYLLICLWTCSNDLGAAGLKQTQTNFRNILDDASSTSDVPASQPVMTDEWVASTATLSATNAAFLPSRPSSEDSLGLLQSEPVGLEVPAAGGNQGMARVVSGYVEPAPMQFVDAQPFQSAADSLPPGYVESAVYGAKPLTSAAMLPLENVPVETVSTLPADRRQPSDVNFLSQLSRLHAQTVAGQKDLRQNWKVVASAATQTTTSAANVAVNAANTAADAANANGKAASEAIEDASVYSQIAIVAPLALQLMLVSCVGLCVWRVGLELEFWTQVVPAVLILLLCDIAWIVFCLTGMLDKYVKEALIIGFCAILAIGHVIMIFAFIQHWFLEHRAVKDISESYRKIKKNTRVFEKHVMNTMKKMDAFIIKKVPDIGDILSLEDPWLSDEDESAPDYKAPPDDRAKKLNPMRVTVLGANGLVNSDGKSVNPFDHSPSLSDPYFSVAMRGRKAACWHRCTTVDDTLNPVFKKNNSVVIADFRDGDILKFKVWDDDSIELHLPGDADDLMGKLKMNSDEIQKHIGHGEFPMPLTLPSESDEAKPKQCGTLRLKIEDISPEEAKKTQARKKMGCC